MYRIRIRHGKYTPHEVRLERHVWWIFWETIARYDNTANLVRQRAMKWVEYYGITEVIDETK